jgi:tetratricopeptide (TPR) repeat protein
MAKQTKNTENVEFEELTSTEGFFDKYKNVLIYSAIGVVIVVLGIIGYQKLYQAPKEVESQEAIWNALYDFQNDSLETAVNGTDEYSGFEDIATNYSGTSGGDIANYSMGIIRMEEGLFDEALEYFDECDFDDVMIGNLTIGLKGDCNVELGEYETAAKYFEEAANREPNEYTTPMFLKKAGLTYEELGDFSNAVKVYTRIKDEYPQSSEGADIEKFIARATK